MPIQKKSVFVVDDDADVRDSLYAVLSTLGYECRSFESAETLIAQWENALCDFLIIDVDLPGMNGVDLLKQLRADGNTTPAMFYSGRIDDHILNTAAALGDIPVIGKGNNIARITDCLIEKIAGDDDQRR